MKGKFIRNISANTFQLAVNQLFGFAIFYILSKELDKNNFGQINWALAVLLTAFSILSCGIDQVAVKKIAAGNDPHAVLSLYICHVLMAGSLFYGALFIGQILFPNLPGQYHILLLLGIGKLMFFFSSPFKQLANGLEKFNLLAYMSVGSNIVRGTGLIVVALFHSVSMPAVIFVFIVGDVVELLFSVYFSHRIIKQPLRILWNKQKYIHLVKESLPQVGVVIFTSAIARFDWIFIGVMVSSVKLAEYSFAYKVFEIATLPLLALAPLLIPWFTRVFQRGERKDRSNDLIFLVRLEMILASFIALMLNLLWIPLIDPLTSGKYGATNSNTILILSLCMPLLYISNFLWSILFAKGRLKRIFFIITVTFIVNLAGDIILIHFWGNEGAAAAYFLAILVQSVLYISTARVEIEGKIWLALVICPLCAFFSGLLAHWLSLSGWLAMLVGAGSYILLLLATAQMRPGDWLRLKKLIN